MAFNKQTTIKWGHKAETVQDEAGLLLCYLDSRRQHRFCGRLRYDIMYEDQIAADTISLNGQVPEASHEIRRDLMDTAILDSCLCRSGYSLSLMFAI